MSQKSSTKHFIFAQKFASKTGAYLEFTPVHILYRSMLLRLSDMDNRQFFFNKPETGKIS